MSEHPPPPTLLADCVQAVAGRIGDRLPAAFDMSAGPVVLDGEAAAHVMPDEPVAVRWPVVGQDAALVVAVTADSVPLLTADGSDVVSALTATVAPVAEGLAPLFDGTVPVLGPGAQVPPAEALAEGPGDGVSVALDDAGTHRVTVGLRMVVGDHLLVDVGGDGGAELPDDGGGFADDGDELAEGDELADDAVLGRSGQVLRADADGGAGGGATPLGDPSGGRTAPDHRSRPAAQDTAGDQPQTHPASFASFDQLRALPGAAHSMAMLGEVEMGVTAELGRTRLTVRDVLGLNPGSIIELDRAAGSPVDVVVNGTLIARGEVVVIDEEFGIRITEILGMTDEPSPFPLPVAQ